MPLKCNRCSSEVDPSQDPDCEVYTGNYKRLHSTTILCERCRYELDADQDYYDSLAARAEIAAQRAAE